jgi:NAD(P)-dependent dehydrogenase (short-subunit alcohol dehydrogenase family)
MSTKSEIAAKTARQNETEYGDLIARYGDRRALVVGSDGGENIGARIARSLVLERFLVNEPTQAGLDVTHIDRLDEYGFGTYDTLVLANGVTDLAWLEDQTPDKIVSILDNTLTGSMLATRQFVEETMYQRHLKYIVFVGSMAHRSVLNASAYYCAAKAGLDMFARCAAWELGPKGYRVFIVHPSNVEGTPMTEATIQGLMAYRGISREDAENYWAATRALPRWLRAAEIGRIVRWLVTQPEAEWLAGTSIDLSGGTR